MGKHWLISVVIALVLVFAGATWHYRIDLTQEQRFSLSEPSKQLLQNIDSTIRIEVFLTGDLPADYKKLSLATEQLLDECKAIAGNKLEYRFFQPGAQLNDTLKYTLYDSLRRLGVVFEQNTEGDADKQQSRMIIPSALIFYKNYRPFAVDLRSSRTVFKNYNVVNDVPQEDKEATRNAAEALLEFKFTNAIDKLTRTKIPVVAYAIGNGQPMDNTVFDLVESLRNEYRFGIFDLKKAYPKANEIDLLLMVKPTVPFTDADKLKLDQYVMQGGKIVWAVDRLHAELDSLMRSQADYTAYDRNLNIDDILFKYGVRINNDLVQDLNCAKIPVVTGYNPDGKPQMQRIPWPYYPFLAATGNSHPIAKNLDRVLPIFPSSIDTIKSPGITKTILLATDTTSRRLSTPAIVSLNSVRTEEDFLSFNKSFVPVAVLLEGKFSSLFANRLSAALMDSVQQATGLAFAPSATVAGKQIVLSDADLLTNVVSPTNGPGEMGTIPFENYRFANREFFLNCVEYMVSDSKILENRSKDVTLRLLDKTKVADQKSLWQFINIAIPVLLILGLGGLLQWRRKKRFGGAGR
jgi:gliding-associated putative ABC transporter substrate-binding component GldG